MAPAGTPADIVARLNRTTNEALADASVHTRLEQIGYSVAGGGPSDFADAIQVGGPSCTEVAVRFECRRA